MSKKKRIQRLLARPTDMRFEEVELILKDCGYKRSHKTSGSHFVFSKDGKHISIPTKNNKVKKCYLNEIIDILGLEE